MKCKFCDMATQTKRGSPVAGERGARSAAAAAAGEQQDDEDDPDPVVVVEDVAQTVVHSVPPDNEVMERGSRLHYHCMSKWGECAWELVKKEKGCRDGTLAMERVTGI
jgi:hypothetical protein